MGLGYLLHCEKCGFEEEMLLGTGFGTELYLLDEICAGNHGEGLKKVIDSMRKRDVDEQEIRLRLDCEWAPFSCPECKKLERNLYVGMDNGVEPPVEKEYVCPDCGCKMIPQDVPYDRNHMDYPHYNIETGELECINPWELPRKPIPCPKCYADMKISEAGTWD